MQDIVYKLVPGLQEASIDRMFSAWDPPAQRSSQSLLVTGREVLPGPHLLSRPPHPTAAASPTPEEQL
ncbi:hypothetical protein P7K49_005775 [Saguinus oedipus]|uniref:Uncharacterized protein n=1 Tax=Saguinus oedipus TaxID=9490 RepID=A0ABQ9W268_SAGOE|nr:hypothetical protein P7K49_005775 [Saguinus oedipus]